MPPVDTGGYPGTLSLSGSGGDSRVVGGNIHEMEDLILDQFLNRDACASICLGRIGAGEILCVKTRLVSGGGVMSKNCGVETHRGWKWEPPPPDKAFLIPGRGDSIFINPFLFRSKLSSNIFAILECTNSTEFGMRTFFHITDPQH